jgi:pimeloyl-ACP methyl ester carboxylesterase
VFLTYTSASRPLALRSVYRRGPSLGQSFHWLEAGWDNDETIVLLHGLMAHSMAYRKVVPRLAPHYRLIIPDLPAHGRDQTFRSHGLVPKVDALVDWLGELLAVIDAERVHLVGHSLGALTSFMAARSPAKLAPVDSVTLVSPGIRIGVPPWLHHLFGRLPLRLARLGASSLGIRAYEPIQWRKSRMTSLEVDAYVQPFRQPDRLRFMMDVGVDLVRQPDRLVGAEQIDHRTLIVWGDKDHLLSVDTGHLLQASIGDSRLEVIEGVGHCPMEDSPAEFAHLLRNFLGKG